MEAQRYEEEIRAIIPTKSQKIPRLVVHKVNLDGAIFKIQGNCGVGMVIRNDQGC